MRRILLSFLISTLIVLPMLLNGSSAKARIVFDSFSGATRRNGEASVFCEPCTSQSVIKRYPIAAAAGGGGLAFDAVGPGSTGTTPQGASSLTFSHTTGSLTNGYMVVGTFIFGNNPVSSITYNGVSLTNLGGSMSGQNDFVELWGLANPSSGAHNVVVTFSASNDCGAGSMTFNNVANGHGTIATAGGNSSSPAVTVTSATGEIIVDVLGVDFNATMTGTGGATERWNQGPSASFDTGAGSTTPGAASVSRTWTLGSGQSWAIAAIPLKP